ncbi:MAG: hypothetical protein BWY75_01428 [bacterium ADurb.Bin425]|nr:MAG: hypothetical protein BWY75_01428 [bacterium ADurb.Bin425]
MRLAECATYNLTEEQNDGSTPRLTRCLRSGNAHGGRLPPFQPTFGSGFSDHWRDHGTFWTEAGGRRTCHRNSRRNRSSDAAFRSRHRIFGSDIHQNAQVLADCRQSAASAHHSSRRSRCSLWRARSETGNFHRHAHLAIKHSAGDQASGVPRQLRLDSWSCRHGYPHLSRPLHRTIGANHTLSGRSRR